VKAQYINGMFNNILLILSWCRSCAYEEGALCVESTSKIPKQPSATLDKHPMQPLKYVDAGTVLGRANFCRMVPHGGGHDAPFQEHGLSEGLVFL
jgi:hypothetical protein